MEKTKIVKFIGVGLAAMMLLLPVLASAACQITVTSPNGGENWCAGQSKTITWTSSGTSGMVNIKYSTSGGLAWQTIKNSTNDDGAYSWTVPNTPSSNCLVKICDVSDATCCDQSNSMFTISEALQADFSSSLYQGETCEAYFRDESSGYVTSWSWDFGDGGTSSQQNPIHTYNCGSSYTVSLTVTGPCGSNTKTKTNCINCPCPCLTVTSPNGGETWCDGSSKSITWTSSGTSGIVNIKYSTNGGSSWQTIKMSTNDDGSYSWTVPNTPSSNCLVKICDVSDPTCCDQSNSMFTISEALQADFSSSLYQGETCEAYFRDESSGYVTSWSWDFGDGGTSSQQNPIHTYNCGSSYTVSLTVTGPCGSNTKTKTNCINCPCPCLTVTSPNGGETWCDGSSKSITWTSSGTSGMVTLTYSTNGGSSWQTIKMSTNDDGAYAWTVPNTPSSNCLVKICDMSDPSCCDQSNSSFTISTCECEFIVTSPNGGQTWCPGQSETITWTSQYTCGMVIITYSTNSGSSWQTIKMSTNDDGAYAWTVPNTPSSNCLVKICDLSDPSCCDQSNSSFTICGAPQANFSGTPTNSQGQTCTVQFTDQSSGCVSSRSWNFGDGGTSSQKNPIHTYDCGGTYNVSLSVSGPCGSDSETKNNYITCTCPSEISLTSPNGGETWCVGQTENITWASSNTSGMVEIDYSTNNGSSWQTAVSSTPDDGAHPWTVPNTPSSNCLVKVCDASDPNSCDQSNGPFTICDPPQADFSGTPTNSEGQTCQVQFTDQSSGCVTGWSWDFGDGGTSSQQNPGHTYDCGGTYTVILTASGPCGSDVETKNDYIACACPCMISVTSPNGGETCCVGQFYNITWTSNQASGNVKIEHSTDGGTSWHIVKASTPDDGIHLWTVPDGPSMDCLIRICDATISECCDISDDTFQICECGIIDILTDSLSCGTEGCQYEDTVEATGGCLPYFWSIASGHLPDGLDLESGTGIISGTPACVESCHFTIEVEDLLGTTDAREYCLIIGEYEGVKGDVNRDGQINILDVLALVNHILGQAVITNLDDLLRADCNSDGVINILDALAIVRVILGEIPGCTPGSSCMGTLTPEVLEFLKALEPHLSAEGFFKLMVLVKPEVQLPTEYGLAQNYPNPFNPTTSIQYSVVSDQFPPHVTLKIYNLLGQEVRTLVDEAQEPGYYEVTWDGKESDGRQAASGVYFYHLMAGEFTAMKRMVLMK